MARRVVETAMVNKENDRLLLLTVFEEGLNKETVKKENRLTKKHAVLYKSVSGYEFK